jgi:nitrogen fixation/metabolism regulation signal transduction histidine kinase
MGSSSAESPTPEGAAATSPAPATEAAAAATGAAAQPGAQPVVAPPTGRAPPTPPPRRFTTRRRVAASFGVQLMVRVAALFALLVALAYLISATRLYAVTAVVAILAVVQAVLVLRYAGRVNRELARLLTAIRHDDFSQGFAIAQLGASFAELAASFDEVTRHFRATRMEREAQRRYLEALVEHVPVAILAVAEDESVSLLNSAARRLLDASAATTLDGLHRYGASFQRDVVQSKSGHRSLTRTELDGVQRHLVLSTTQLRAGGANLRLITLQDIQAELDFRELAAWQDMARVLTHEIMNSLTPIASLARTADELVGELAGAAGEAKAGGPADEVIDDLQAAVHTLARRSDSLMRFVRNYRELTQMPPPVMAQLALPDYLRRVARLFSAEWAARGVTLHVTPPAEGLTLRADESLLDQALINLLRNAADAALHSHPAGHPDGEAPQVWLEARRSDRGRPILEISDNGAGLDEELGEKIFLPFFTTKADGSGIGLALARQVMLVHQGAITAGPRPGGGARFRLTF